MGITFDYFTSIISVTSPQTELTMQELADAISDEEASPWGMSYPGNSDPGMAEIAGKFPKGGGNYSEIIVELYTPWQVQFWGGSGVTKTSGGSLLGGLGGVPVKATGTAGDITLVSQPVDGSYAVIQSGTSGLTPEESAALLDLQTDVEYLRGMEKGEWSIAGNQMIFKNESDVEIARFDLFDENGTPSMINVFKRTPV